MPTILLPCTVVEADVEFLLRFGVPLGQEFLALLATTFLLSGFQRVVIENSL